MRGKFYTFSNALDVSIQHLNMIVVHSCMHLVLGSTRILYELRTSECLYIQLKL